MCVVSFAGHWEADLGGNGGEFLNSTPGSASSFIADSPMMGGTSCHVDTHIGLGLGIGKCCSSVVPSR